jgi:hypothetical protein
VHWTSSSIALLASATLFLIAPGAQAQTPLNPGEIARVADTPITQAAYDHAYAVAEKMGSEDTTDELRAFATTSLIYNVWLDGEAAEQGIVVSAGSVTGHLRTDKRQTFRTEREYRKFLKESGLTPADMRRRSRNWLIGHRLSAKVTAGAKTDAGREHRLERFRKAFATKWKARTTCAALYSVKDQCGTTISA